MNLTIIGLGYVGLPVACAFAKAGVCVYGVDKNPTLLSALTKKEYSYTEPLLNETLDEVLGKTLFVSDSITETDTYIVTVQTPVDENHKPDNSFVECALSELAPHIKNGDLIILESTVPIGANKNFIEQLRSQVAEGVDFQYCYCPESILPGNIFHEITMNARVIGGSTMQATVKAKEIYDLINQGTKDLTDIVSAEFVKLVQNAHRDVELAFVNQLSVMCDREDVDVFRLIEMINQHPRCHLLQPGSGVGGHCIAVDPYFLIERFGEDASLLKTAREANHNKPIYIVKKAIKMMDGDFTKVVGVLGLSYKANCDDCRESSGIAICKALQEQGVRVLANEINSSLKIISGFPNLDLQEVIRKSNIIIIAQKHAAYQSLDCSGKMVLDCVGLF